MNQLVTTVACGRGIGVVVETVGTGSESVLFVHGLGANRGCWHRARQYFDLTRYRLICADLPGFGASARPDDFDYSMTSLGDCLFRTISALHADRLHIVAHSMGSVAAMVMLEKYALVPDSFAAAEGNLVADDAFMSSKVARLSESVFLRSYSKWLAMVKRSLGNEPSDQHDRFVESLKTASPIAVHRASLSCCEWTRSGVLSRQFASLKCPLAYLYGDATPALRPLPEVVLLHRVAQFPIAGQGHFMMESAAAFYGALAGWIAAVSGGRRLPFPS